MEYVELTNANHIDPHVVNELDDDSQQVAEAMVQLGTMGYYPPEHVPDGGVEADGMEFKIHQMTHHDHGKTHERLTSLVCNESFILLLSILELLSTPEVLFLLIQFDS